jgi:hypothetical protein
MWRWRVCSLLVLAACTSDSGADSDFQLNAAVHDGKLSLSVVGYKQTAQPSDSAFIADLNTASASFQSHTIALVFNPYRFPPGYYADVDVTDPVGDEEPISFTIDRQGTRSTVTAALPSDFTVAAPVDPKVDAPIDITWSPISSDLMSWQGSACQMEDVNGPVPTDTGLLEFPPVVFDPERANVCPDAIELTMTRSRTITPESAFRYMTVVCKRQHTVNFMITP